MQASGLVDSAAQLGYQGICLCPLGTRQQQQFQGPHPDGTIPSGEDRPSLPMTLLGMRKLFPDASLPDSQRSNWFSLAHP